jgi:hypothetical protein
MHCLLSLSKTVTALACEVPEGPGHEGNELETFNCCATSIKGTMYRAKTSFGTKVFAGALMNVAQHFVLLRYTHPSSLGHYF